MQDSQERWCGVDQCVDLLGEEGGGEEVREGEAREDLYYKFGY